MEFDFETFFSRGMWNVINLLTPLRRAIIWGVSQGGSRGIIPDRSWWLDGAMAQQRRCVAHLCAGFVGYY